MSKENSIRNLNQALEYVRTSDKSCFIKLVNEHFSIEGFDWQSWEEGAEFERKGEWKVADKDEAFCLKLLTSIVRNDRFTDGFIEKHFRSGLLIKIVQRLIELNSSNTEIKTYHSGDLASALSDYEYQPSLTKKLDAHQQNFDAHTINEIALWKVDRYFQIPENLLYDINATAGLMPGEHRVVQDMLEQLLDIKGIDIAMASTILRFRNPDVFQIIDKRAYRVVYGEPLKLYYTTPTKKKVETYFEYLDRLIEIAQKSETRFSDLDRALYQMDIELNKNIRL
ncbi:MAG: DUF6508 domain-containing protein [Cyclobacteriaceae bacterium]